MRIRPSVRRMHKEDWRPWQREEYLGVHTGFIPADGAQLSYQYRPIQQPAIALRPPQPMARAPQADYWLQQADDRSIWELFKEWLKK